MTTANRFVPVSRRDLVDALTEWGFTPTTGGRELVFTRPHADPRFTIKVYTSLPADPTADTVRAAGADAIRVCLVFTTPTGHVRGASKSVRVNRTGSVAAIIERTRERARAMWAAASGMARNPPAWLTA